MGLPFSELVPVFLTICFKIVQQCENLITNGQYNIEVDRKLEKDTQENER